MPKPTTDETTRLVTEAIRKELSDEQRRRDMNQQNGQRPDSRVGKIVVGIAVSVGSAAIIASGTTAVYGIRMAEQVRMQCVDNSRWIEARGEYPPSPDKLTATIAREVNAATLKELGSQLTAMSRELGVLSERIKALTDRLDRSEIAKK